MKGLTAAEVLALPALVPVAATAKALNIAATTLYNEVRADTCPLEALHFGTTIRFRRVDILELLGIEDMPHDLPSATARRLAVAG